MRAFYDHSMVRGDSSDCRDMPVHHSTFFVALTNPGIEGFHSHGLEWIDFTESNHGYAIKSITRDSHHLYNRLRR